MKTKVIWCFSLVLLSFLVGGVSAHTPLKPDDNESLETATLVVNPTKSWAIYAELHEGEEAQYYRLDLRQGERLRAMLFIPLEEKGFEPNLVIMGPNVSSQDEVPEYVEVPDGAGVMLVKPDIPVEPAYEPFTPSSYYYLASSDMEAPVNGTYYVSVYETSRGGRYGLAVGYREEFGLDEWIRVPIDTVSIHQWEGQSLAFILAPMVATVAIGFLVLVWRRKELFRIFRVWTGSVAGLLYVGSGVMMLVQMFIALSSATFDPSVILTVIFALLPILLGLGILRFTMRESLTGRARGLIALFGLLGLFSWAGLLVGPAMALLGSILPGSRAKVG